MPFMRIGLFLVPTGREAEAADLVERALARLDAAPGCTLGLRVRERVGHGDRWQGWITSWDSLDALEAASEATAAETAALRALAEPRTCQEVVLETEAFEGDTRTGGAGDAPSVAEPPPAR